MEYQARIWSRPALAVACLIAAVCFFPVQTLAQASFKISDQTNLPGSDYSNFPVANDDLYACVNACRQQQQCQAFSYVRAGVQGTSPRCWLKSAVPAAKSDGCCISGIKQPATLSLGDSWQQEGLNLPGSDSKSVILDSTNADQCRSLCFGDTNCRAYTVVKSGVQGPGARCWLKTSIPGSQADACCTSGIMSYLPADLDDLSLEPNTDFPGSNLQSFDLPRADVTLCAAACKNDTACRAYTYVRPGVQAAQARCWLKKSVGEVTHNSCCASGRKPVDSGQHTALVRGKPVTAQSSCQQSTTADIFNKICSIMPAVKCQITDESCGSRTRQLYVGSSFSASTQTEIKKWNFYGGRGKLLGEATMCSLRELSPKALLGNGLKLGGPIEVADSGSTLLGDFSVKQQVGLLNFDQAKREFKGYRRLSFCAPVVGCYDSVAQDIFVGLGTYKLNPAATAGTGGPKLDQHFVLNVTTETSEKALVLVPPSFIIPTPVGPISVQPEFDYGSRDSVADSPYSGSHQTLRKPGDESGWLRQALLKDIYGVDYGIAFADLNPNPRAISGWLSPTALGNRDPSVTGSVWQPSDTNVRPDGDLAKARSSDEKKSATEIKAKAKVSYPKDGKLGSLVPSWIANLAGDVTLSIFVEPSLRTAFSGQFDILPSEGVVPPGDIGAGGTWTGSDLRIKTAVASAVDFTVTAGLDLTISFPFPVGTVVDVHPRWAPKPIFEKPGFKAGDISYFASGDGPWPTTEPKHYTFFKTFKTGLLTGNDAGAAYSYVEACLAPNKQLPAEPPPAPTGSPGDPSKLFTPDAIEWPCNVCLAVNGKGQSTLFPATRPPGAKPWHCDFTFKSGCHDMCRFNPASKSLTFLFGPDQNMKIGNSNGEMCYTVTEPPK